MRSNWPLAIQEECENACFRTFATRFLVLSALEEAVRGIGEHWHSLEVGFKPYPVGLFNIGPVEACLAMLGEAPIDVGQIEAVNIETYHDARKFTGEKDTTTRSNYVDAHLSMPCSVAVTLMDGEMPPRQLTDERLQDPAVHELAAKVKVVESEAMNRQYPHDWPLTVTIRLADGSRREHHIQQVKRREHGSPYQAPR